MPVSGEKLCAFDPHHRPGLRGFRGGVGVVADASLSWQWRWAQRCVDGRPAGRRGRTAAFNRWCRVTKLTLWCCLTVRKLALFSLLIDLLFIGLNSSKLIQTVQRGTRACSWTCMPSKKVWSADEHHCIIGFWSMRPAALNHSWSHKILSSSGSGHYIA